MKIAFLVWQFPVLSETFILNQITGLIDRGHDVYIHALNGCPTETTKIHPVVEKYNLLERTYCTPKIPENSILCVLKGLWLLASNMHKNSFSCMQLLNIKKYGKTFASWKQIYRIIALLEAHPYDIIHCQFGTLGSSALTLRQAGYLQGKLVTTFRGNDISSHIKLRGKDVYKELFTYGDFFIANCEFFRNRAIQLGCNPQKIVVLGSGIDCQIFPFQPRQLTSEGSLRIATTGRLVEKKGIEYAIEAVAKVAQAHPNIEYNIIGDGPLKSHLQALIDELGVGQIVKLLGWKQQREVVKILNTCQLFLAPSVTASDGNQDAPVNTLKEAMLMGLAVVSTDHGGIPELVEDGVTGLLVPEKDAAAIADKLIYLIEHPTKWISFGQAGHEKVKEKYDMNQLNDKLVDLYQNLLRDENVLGMSYVCSFPVVSVTESSRQNKVLPKNL